MVQPSPSCGTPILMRHLNSPSLLSLLHPWPPSQQLCLSLLPMQVKKVEPYSHHPVTMRDQQQHWPETGRLALVVRSRSQDTTFQDLGTKGLEAI